jgi:hypothetical protein
LIAKSELRKQFFELLFKDYEGFICFATSEAAAPKATFRQHFFSWPKDHAKIEQFLLYNEQNRNLYFCINLLSKMERRKEFCLESDIVWADLDEKNPQEIEDIPPQIVIQSSPGRWQAFWRLTAKLPPYEAEEYSRRIAYKYGADKSGWDLGQLFRVPFTKNLKYQDRPPITISRAFNTEAPAKLFESLPNMFLTKNDPDIPQQDSEATAGNIIYKYGSNLQQTRFSALYYQEPERDADWSRLLWNLIHECFKAGMSPQEVFTVARSAPVNKYERDGRPAEHLWKDVLKASAPYASGKLEAAMLVMPELVTEPKTRTFVDEYREWGIETSDAPEAYHDLCCLITSSAIISGAVRFDTNSGLQVPNIWGMILGPSTIGRKTTVMSKAMSFLMKIDPKLIVANEATPEGILTGLSERPHRTSIFWRDEVSGLFELMNRREHYVGMQTTLAKLYDVPEFHIKRLKSDVYHIESAAFIFLAGGVTDSVFDAITEGYITQGFLPRFLVICGEPGEYRPVGPPSDTGKKEEARILNRFADLYEAYFPNITMKVGGQEMTGVPPRIMASLTDEAWERSQRCERLLIEAAKNSVHHKIALPTFDRLNHSLRKIAVVLASLRQNPVDERIEVNDQDMINAAHYIQDWGRYSIELMSKAGRKPSEIIFSKTLTMIMDYPGILRGTLMKHLHLDKNQATQVLDTLEERGEVRKEKRGRGWAYFSE